MTATDWLFLFEFGGGFAAFILFCLWQLRQLDKLDAEDKRNSEPEKD